MVLEAARDLGLDLQRSYLVGDKSSDIECGRRAGVRTALVMTGYGAGEACKADITAPDFSAAVEHVLAEARAAFPQDEGRDTLR
jgi:D-glycero-D-manno-heptose 1,7-bisphosphate phosphatase